MAMVHDAGSPDSIEARDAKIMTIEAYITGRVQGVGFRACVRRIATHLSVTGEVMNLEDGRVCIRAAAEEVIIDKFISSLHECPRAFIRDIQIFESEPEDFEDFSIVRIY